MSERRGSVVNQAQACPQQPDLGTGRTSSWGRWSRPSLGKMVTAPFIFDDSIRCACQVRKALLAPPLLAGVTECPPPSRSRASLVRGLGGELTWLGQCVLTVYRQGRMFRPQLEGAWADFSCSFLIVSKAASHSRKWLQQALFQTAIQYLL